VKHSLRVAAIALAAVTLLAGCSSDSLAEQYENGTTKNYISGEGTVSEYPAEERGEPVAFEAQTDAGDTVSSEDYAGEVVVLNFWYAGCPPCRLEAPFLEEVNVQFADEPVGFLGVNVRDQAETSLEFAESFDITYPSVIDANEGEMLLAFAGDVAPNAVPTTLVLDKQGRVAARILGGLDGSSTLRTLVDDALAEEG
jgi:thiol-disulfide isomerase/thioredoxin